MLYRALPGNQPRPAFQTKSAAQHRTFNRRQRCAVTLAARPRVPTGAFEPLPSSGQWAQAPHSIDASTDLQGPHLEHCRGNWTAAEQSPELLAQLIQQEVEKGFVKRFEGTEEDAALQWPKGTAIGKLNVVIAEGRDPRLVLDSTVCGLNPAVHIPERVAPPTASDVQRTFLAEDCYAQQTALSIDFKAAHKCNKVHPSEHGTLLFGKAPPCITTQYVILVLVFLHTGGNAQEA